MKSTNTKYLKYFYSQNTHGCLHALNVEVRGK